MINDIIPLRRIVVVSILVTLLSIVIWMATHYGRVDITVPNATSITLRKNIDRSEPIAKSNSSTLSGVFDTGSYVIHAENSDGIVEKVIEIEPSHNHTVSLDIRKKQQFKTITNGPLRSIHTTSSGMTYYIVFDGNSSQLWRESTTRKPERVMPNGEYIYNIAWINDKAVGIASANNRITPFMIDRDTQTMINQTVSGGASIAADKSTNTWKILDNKTLYSVGATTATATKVATLDINYDMSMIGARGDAVAFLEGNKESANQSISVINTKNNQVQRVNVQLSYGADSGFSFGWSPDGNSILISTNRTLSVYDSALKKKDITFATGISSAVWKDSSTIVYGYGNKVWSYNITTGTSETMSQLEPYNSIVGIQYDNQQYLLNASNSAGTLVFQTSDKAGATAAVKLGESNITRLNRSCGMYFTYFTNLYIMLQVTGATAESCQQAATSYLNSIGIDSSVVIFATATQ